jgi:hypothetical protein
MATLALNADVVNRLLTMPKCIELMKTAFLSLAEGTSKQPLRDLIMFVQRVLLFMFIRLTTTNTLW